MSKSNKYAKKRKRGLDVDTTFEPRERDAFEDDREHSPSEPSEPKRSRRKGQQEPQGGSSGNDRNHDDAESISVEETNKIRAQLGLPLLEVDTGPKIRESETEPDEKIVVEYGVEIHHKAPKNLSEEKEAQKIKERLDTHAQKRKIYSKVLKTKGLADSDSEDDSASAWIEKNRKLEEERKKAAEKAKMLDELDETFGVGDILEETIKKPKKPIIRRPKPAEDQVLTAGLTVGHSKDEFVGGTETVLVLADKDVLADDDEEILINPNIMDKERLKRNLEIKKRKTDYNPYGDEELDELGRPKQKQILSKYDDGLDGEGVIPKETFKLDETGGFNLEKETYEKEMKRKLFMQDRQLVSLETPKFQIAREYYTEEEMISFRKPKKGKDGKKIRKRQKALKADELVPEETETSEERAKRAERLAARRREQAGEPSEPRQETGFQEITTESSDKNGLEKKPSKMEVEDGELPEDQEVGWSRSKPEFKSTMGATVNVSKLKSLASKLAKKDSDEEDTSDDDLLGGTNVASIQVDDDAEDELSMALQRARKLKHLESKAENGGESGAAQVRHMLKAHGGIKEEPGSDEEMDQSSDTEENQKGITIDATSEYYKNVGEIPTFGLAGNRDDNVDYSELLEEHERMAREKAKKEQERRKYSDVEDSDASDYEERDRRKKRRQEEIDKERGAWVKEDEPMDIPEEAPGPSSSRKHRDSRRTVSTGNSSDEGEYKNVLGEEKDVSKGVAAMLKLAAEKGYLENKKKKQAGGTLKHLESKRFSKVEQGRYDIEDKYVKKLERMGTTGSGPVRSFPEKTDYKPTIELSYTDQKGRELEPKEAFRVLSWKFHGKGPGKKQIEKRQAKLDKREKLKKMNSMDTPLGTLSKQLKKQEQLQTPYLVLSGGRDQSGAPLTKE